MPTSSSRSPERLKASSGSASSWSIIGSAIWRPTRCTGFREFMAPWNTIDISFHRIARMESSGTATRSRPSKEMEPRTIRPLYGRRRMRARAVVVFPQPLSPARPIASPRSTSKEAPSTACTMPALVVNSIVRSRTSRSAATSAPPKPRVQYLVQCVSEQVEPEHEEHDAESRHDEPFCHPDGEGIVLVCLRDDASPAHVALHGQIEEGEDALREDGDRDSQDCVREDQGERVREDVTEEDVGVRRTNHSAPLDEHPFLQAEHLAPDDPRGDRPTGQADHEDDADQIEVVQPGCDHNH